MLTARLPSPSPVPVPLGPSDPLLRQAMQSARGKLSLSGTAHLGLSVLAGLYIGLAFTFYITVMTGAEGIPWGISRLLAGTAFCLGLVLVVIGGADLFTSTVLTVILWARGEIGTARLLRHWSRVFVGNLVGATALVLLLWLARQHLLADGQWGLTLMNVAQHKLHHGFLQAVALGLLCNLMVCLGIWMSYASKEPLVKAALLVLPVAMFVSAGFEHSIANLFVVPMAILVHGSADAGFWASIGAGPEQFADLTIYHFIFNNLIPVVIGNIIGGGLFVGLAHWWIHDRTRNQPVLSKGRKLMTDTQAQLTVKAITNTQPLQFALDTEVADAARSLITQGADVGLVMQGATAVGFIEVQDLLRGYYLTDAQGGECVRVSEVMQPIQSQAQAEESVTALAQRLAVDESRMHPVSTDGFLLRHDDLTLAGRARRATPKGNGLTLVLCGEVLLGVVSHRAVLTALYPQPRPASTAEVA